MYTPLIPQGLADVQLDPMTGYPPVVESEHPNIAGGLLAPYKWLGVDFPSAAEALNGANAGAWGINALSDDLDVIQRTVAPYSSEEIVHAFDYQRCVDIDPADLSTTPRAWELVHLRVPAGAIGVIEDIPTIWDDVTALDAAGVPVFSYGDLNGQRLCRNELVHPDPLVTEPLRWTFHLGYIDDSYLKGASMAYLSNVDPSALLDRAVVPSWNDARVGAADRWGSEKQYLVPADSVPRVWVQLTGPTDRFRIRVGARLAGFTQFGGRLGRALENATVRHT